jgi:hypothetical protein
MKFITLGLGLFLVFLWGGVRGALGALEAPSPTPMDTPETATTLSPTQTPLIPKPFLLKDSDKMHDSENHGLPKLPGKGPDGKPLEVGNSGRIPRGGALDNLADPSFLAQVPDFNKTENKSKTYYWHPWKGPDYCHYRDASSNHWYGWQSGGDFSWVFFKAGHFWWHDTYAERWLYYDQGYWWWQGSKKNQFQVYLEDGHYHVIDAGGTLGDDLFTTGTEEVVTEPVSKETSSTRNKEEDISHVNGGMGGLNH